MIFKIIIQRLWETVIIYNRELENVKLTSNKNVQVLELFLNADPESLFATPVTPQMSKLIEKKIVLKFNENEKRTELERLCAQFYENKFQVCFVFFF